VKIFGDPGILSYIYNVNNDKIKVMIVLFDYEKIREFTCKLTGDQIKIVRLSNGEEIALKK